MALSRPLQCRLETLEFYSDITCEERCTCFRCCHWLNSTYCLAYFVRHGLQLPSDTFPLRIYVDLDFVARLFQILEERTTIVREEPPRLVNWAAYSVWREYFTVLDSLPLPELIKTALKDFTLVEPIMEFLQSRLTGMTVIKPWSLPLTCLRHLDAFIYVGGYERFEEEEQRQHGSTF